MSEIRRNRRDVAVLVGKGVIGAIPIVGSLAAEVVGAVIPNQRLDRVEALLRAIDEQVRDLSRSEIEERFTHPEFVDLLEDGMQQASRALQSERIQRIAAVLKNSLADGELKRLQDKKLLALLGELNDVELLILTSFATRNQQDPEFIRKHASTLQGPSAVLGSDQSVIDEAALHEEYKNHLVRLGLLRSRFRKPDATKGPEFDEHTGMLKASGRELTPLGRLLLRRIDLLSDEEY